MARRLRLGAAWMAGRCSAAGCLVGCQLRGRSWVRRRELEGYFVTFPRKDARAEECDSNHCG